MALLRSRGEYDGQENLNFEVTGYTNTDALTLSLVQHLQRLRQTLKVIFSLTGNALTLDNFSYECSFDKTKRNYITKVLGRNEKDGKTALFVEELYQNMFETGCC